MAGSEGGGAETSAPTSSLPPDPPSISISSTPSPAVPSGSSATDSPSPSTSPGPVTSSVENFSSAVFPMSSSKDSPPPGPPSQSGAAPKGGSPHPDKAYNQLGPHYAYGYTHGAPGGGTGKGYGGRPGGGLSLQDMPGGVAPWAMGGAGSSSYGPGRVDHAGQASGRNSTENSESGGKAGGEAVGGGSPSEGGSDPSSPSSPHLLPVPRSFPIPVVDDVDKHEFRVPEKKIFGAGDMDKFLVSDARRLYLGFVVNLSGAILGHKLSDSCHVSPSVSSIVSMLETFSVWVDETPPVTTAVRYGNPAFRQWHARLVSYGPDQVEALLGTGRETRWVESACDELFPYLSDSFGNATRIDYGTGHEANFCAFLLCLARIGIVTPDDFQALVSKVFAKYLDLMRKLQKTYWLEPAGSHGVWGLDDYHFLPFIFGSAQLAGHKYMKPRSVMTDDILESFSHEYLYLSCVAFVKSVKKGPLAEHSPMLHDISGVPTWQKVHSGMLKMYQAECLGKFPIMQHFLFGSLIPWPEVTAEGRSA